MFGLACMTLIKIPAFHIKYHPALQPSADPSLSYFAQALTPASLAEASRSLRPASSAECFNQRGYMIGGG